MRSKLEKVKHVTYNFLNMFNAVTVGPFGTRFLYMRESRITPLSTQWAFICSKSKMKTPEQCWKSAQR